MAQQAERNYARFVARWKTRPAKASARAPQPGKAGVRHLAALPADAPRFATRSLAQRKIPRRTQKRLSISSVV